MATQIETESASAVCEICETETASHACTIDGYPFFRCTACGFVFLSPMPANEALHAIYNDDYRDASASFYPKAASRRRRTFVKSLRFFPYVVGKRVLDIGCGGGFMTQAFARLGAKATGLDVSDGSIAYARAHFPGCTFYCEGLETFARHGLEFDFVFSTEVMEHIPAARPFMALLEAVTKRGAIVYIATPDSEHRAVPSRFEDWSDLQPPHHVQFFNRRNMTKLFEEYGFRLKRTYPKRTPALSLLFERA